MGGVGSENFVVKLDGCSDKRNGGAVIDTPAIVQYIVYGSIAVEPFGEQALLSLLDGARAFNERLSITGLLLYKEGKFLQYLEGPIGDLEALYARIERDPRHRAVTIIACGESERQFGDWSMGFKNLTDWRPPKLFRGASSIMSTPFDPQYFGSNPSDAKRILLAFRGLG